MGSQQSVCTIFTLAAEYQTPEGGYDFQFLEDYIDMECVHADAHTMLKREKYQMIISEGKDLMPELWTWIDCPDIKHYPAYDEDPVNFKIWANDYDGNTERLRIVVRQTSEEKYRSKTLKWYNPIAPPPTPAELRRASASDEEEEVENVIEGGESIKMIAMNKTVAQASSKGVNSPIANELDASQNMSVVHGITPSSSNSASLSSINTSVTAGITSNTTTDIDTPLTSPPDSPRLLTQSTTCTSLKAFFSEDRMVKTPSITNSATAARANATYPAATHKHDQIPSHRRSGKENKAKPTFELGYDASSEDEDDHLFDYFDNRKIAQISYDHGATLTTKSNRPEADEDDEDDIYYANSYDSASIVGIKDGHLGYFQNFGRKMRNRRNLWKVLVRAGKSRA